MNSNSNFAWQLFLDEIRQAREELGNPDPVWYRGHADETWSLLPTLFRVNSGADKEEAAFHEFKRIAARLFKDRDNDWETLFDMQHYGIPTRLLDWSEVLGVAIAFITYTSHLSQRDSAVYVLDPVKLNALSKIDGVKRLPFDKHFEYTSIYWHHDPFAAERPIAIYPPLQNERMFAQRATFTVHGHNELPLEDLCQSVVRKVRLTSGAKVGAREFLEHANLNEYAIYPDIVGMSAHIRKKIFGF